MIVVGIGVNTGLLADEGALGDPISFGSQRWYHIITGLFIQFENA